MIARGRMRRADACGRATPRRSTVLTLHKLTGLREQNAFMSGAGSGIDWVRSLWPAEPEPAPGTCDVRTNALPEKFAINTATWPAPTARTNS
jgi:hypothetical protein